MSIQIGTYDLIANPRTRTFTNERIKLFSDVQSNLIEIASSCNETTIIADKIQFGASNNNSNFFIDTYIYGNDTFRLLDISRSSSKIDTGGLTIPGSVTIGCNLTVGGSFLINQPIQSTSVTTSNIRVYSDYTNSKPFALSSNNIEIFSLQTDTSRLIIQPNVGIGTTLPKYKLQVEGSIYSSDTLYATNISSNINSPNITLFGNLAVKGNFTTTGGLSFEGTQFKAAAVDLDNINNFDKYAGISLVQKTAGYPLAVINTKNNDNSTTPIFGISSSGRVYIGTDVSNQTYINSLENSPANANAMFSISMPSIYSNDQLFKAISYNTSNQIIVSSNAYVGIGTTMIRHPLHVYIQSNVNAVGSLSDTASVGLYHSNMPNKPFIISYSNNTPVFSVSSEGSVNIGSNSAIFLGSNGVITGDRLISSNILFYNSIAAPVNNINLTGFNTIHGNTVIASNIINSNLVSSNITTYATITSSNITTNSINVAEKAFLNDIYLLGSLSGPNVSNFNGQSTGDLFTPASEGTGSISYFKSSNVLMSVNTSNYVNELNTAIAGGSNGLLQVKTYQLANKHISPGVSVYGYDRSSILVTANKPYYQLQRPAVGTPVAYNIGINASDELYFGSSNGTDTDFTATALKMNDSTVTLGKSGTLLYANNNSSIFVSTVGNTGRLLTTGFEVRGSSYFQTGSGSAIIYMNGSTGFVGIGNTTPRKLLDVNGDVIISSSLGIGTTLPRAPLHVQGIAYVNGNIGIGTTTPRQMFDLFGSGMISTSLGIGTTLPRNELDVVGTIRATNYIGDASGLSNITFSNYRTFNWVTSSPDPSFILNSGSLTYSTQKGIQRFVDNKVEYNVSMNAAVSVAPTTTTEDYYLTLPYPVNTSLYLSTSNVIGELWTEVITPTTDLFYKTVARIYPTNTNYAIVRLLSGTTEIPFSTVRAGAIIKMMGTLEYATTTTSLGTSLSNIDVNIVSSLTTTNINASNINATYNMTTSNLNFTGYLLQNGSPYIGSQWTTNAASIYYNSGNIGIGTATPRQKLDVIGDIISSTNIGIGTTLPRTNLDIIGNSYISASVGIGTTLPGASLHVVNAIKNNNLTASRVLVSDANQNITSSTVTSTTLATLDATSSIQTQLDGKQATITGAATSITTSDLTASRALVSDASGKVAVSSSVSSTELGYLNGVTSDIQTQINNISSSLSTTNITYFFQPYTHNDPFTLDTAGSWFISIFGRTENRGIDAGNYYPTKLVRSSGSLFNYMVNGTYVSSSTMSYPQINSLNWPDGHTVASYPFVFSITQAITFRAFIDYATETSRGEVYHIMGYRLR